MSGATTKSSTAITVVVVSSTLPAHSGDQVPRFVLDQALAFGDQGATIHLLAPHAPASRRGSWPKCEAPRVTQWRFRYAPRCCEVLTDHGIMPALRERPWLIATVPALMIAQFFALWRLVRRVQPDVIYAHWFTPQALIASVVARITRTPFGFTTHASDVAVWQRFGTLGRRIVRSVSIRAAFVTAVSTQTASKLVALLDEPARDQLGKRLRIIPMGIHVADAQQSLGNPHRAIIIARLVEKKGIEVLLDAWPLVVAAVPDAHLTIGGTGPLDGRLRAITRERNLSVDMPGYVTGREKAELLAACGIVVQPSIQASDGDTDGLPVALMEGISAGCIPVASDASGAQDIIEQGINGYLVPSGDSTSLAQALVGAMTLNEADRVMMLKRGRELSLRLSLPRVATEHLVLLAKAADEPKKCSGALMRSAFPIKAAFFVAITIAFGWFLQTVDWTSLKGIHVAPYLLLVSLVLAWLYRYCGVAIWLIVLTHLGARSLPRFHILADIYAKAWLARYIPGTVPWIAGKVYLASEHGIAKSHLAVSSIVEASTQVISAGVISLGLLAFDGRLGEVAPFFQALASIGTLVLAITMLPPVFNRLISVGTRLIGRNIALEVSWRSVCVPMGLYVGSTVISGMSYVVLSHALVSTLSWSDTLFLVGAFGLAGVVGMLTPLVPSGLGTRDGAQLLLLLAIMPAPEATVLVLASRLWSALVDIVFFIGTFSARTLISRFSGQSS